MLSRIRSWILSCMFVGVAFAQQLTIYTEINAPLEYYIAFSKGTSDTIVGAWSGAFDSMKQDKTLERIYHSDYPGLPLPGPATPAS